MQTVKKRSDIPTKVNDSTDIAEIREAFDMLLYVPDISLKPLIIQRIIDYLNIKFSDEDYKLKMFIGYQDSEPSGIVMTQIHPTYTSYGRKCGTFGWLNAKDLETCKMLIEQCEQFIRHNKLRKIRGNINFPKGLGGLGIQAEGFEQQMLYGVAFDNPNSRIIQYLEKLGYKKESEYICMKVTNKEWNSGNKIAKGIRLSFLSLKEIRERVEEFHELIKNSFQGTVPMPDTSGRYRFEEMLDMFEQVPKSTYCVREDLMSAI